MAVTTPQTEAQALFAHVDAIDAFMDSYDPDRYSVEDVAELLARFTRAERLVVAGKTLSAARLARGQLHRRTGHRSAAEYLAAATGDSVGEAKDLLRLGRQLDDQPELAGALRDGKLSRRRATLVSDAVRVNPGKEAELVRGAKTDSEATLRERCLRAKAQGRSGEDGARHDRRLHQDRRCWSTTDPDGAFALSARLTPDTGARVLAALEAQAQRVFEQARRSGTYESPDAYRADALVALVTGQGILGPATTSGEAGTAAGRTPDPRARLVIRADLAALRRGRVRGDELCEVPGVGPVPVETAIAQLGRALTHLVITDGVDVTTVYSPGRHLPMVIRAALLERDSRCVVPGCDARLGLENDHWVHDYARGGPTTLANLARLCRHHHQLRTHQGFQLEGGPGQWRWVPPLTPVVPKRKPKPKRTAKGKAPPPLGTDPPLFTSEE